MTKIIYNQIYFDGYDYYPSAGNTLATKSYVASVISDGYALSSDLSGLNQTVAEHSAQQSEINHAVIIALDAYGNTSVSGTAGEIALFNGTNSINSSDLFAFDETYGLFVDHDAQINGTVLMGSKTSGGANIITEGTWLGLGVAATASTGFDGIEDVVAGHNLEVKGSLKVDGAILNSDLSAQISAIGLACDGYASSSVDLSAYETKVDHSADIYAITSVLDGYIDVGDSSSIGDGYISFFDGDNKLSGDNDLFWDRANNKLVIGGSMVASGLYGASTSSDIPPDSLVVHGGSAYHLATGTNRNSSDLYLTPGFPTMFWTVLTNLAGVVYANVRVNGVTYTFISGTHWNLGSDNTPTELAVSATNLAAAINARTTVKDLITATSTGAVVNIDSIDNRCKTLAVSTSAPSILLVTRGTTPKIRLGLPSWYDYGATVIDDSFYFEGASTPGYMSVKYGSNSFAVLCTGGMWLNTNSDPGAATRLEGNLLQCANNAAFGIHALRSAAGNANLQIYSDCNAAGEHNVVVGTSVNDASGGANSTLLALATDVDNGASAVYKHMFYGDGTAWFLGNVSVPDINLNGALLTGILDGYAVRATEDQRWIDGSAQLQDLRNAADGYDLTETIQTVLTSLDGYAYSTGAVGDGYLAFFTGSNAIAGDNDLYWDRVNNRLGIGKTNPTVSLDVAGVINAAGVTSVGNIMSTGGSLYSIPYQQGVVFGTSQDIKIANSQDPVALSIGLGAASKSLIICENADYTFNFAHPLQTNPTLFIHSANQDTTEWVSLAHDQTDAVISTGKGNLKVNNSAGTAGTIVASNIYNTTAPIRLGSKSASTGHSLTGEDVIIGGVLEVDGVSYFDATAVYAGALCFPTAAANTNALKGNTSLAQTQFCLGSLIGRQLVLGDYFVDYDFDHPTQTNPTLFVHSATNPDTNNTQWLSFTHDQTDGYIETGKGAIKLSPFNGKVLFGDGTNVKGIQLDATNTLITPVTPTSDIVTVTELFKGQNAYADAATNKTGGDIILAGGIGVKYATAVSNTAGAVIITLSVNNILGVNLTSGVEFALGSDNTAPELAVTATNLAAAINANSTLNTCVVAVANAAVCTIYPLDNCFALNIVTNQVGRISVNDSAAGTVKSYGLTLYANGYSTLSTPLSTTWNGQLYSPNGYMLSNGNFLGWASNATLASSGTILTYSPWSGVGGISFDATNSMVKTYDYTSDALVSELKIRSGASYTGAVTNTTATRTGIYSGIPSLYFTVLSNGANSNQRIIANEVTYSMTAGTSFAKGTDDTPTQLAVTATNMKNYINGLTGLKDVVTATSSGAIVYLAPKPICFNLIIGYIDGSYLVSNAAQWGRVHFNNSGALYSYAPTYSGVDIMPGRDTLSFYNTNTTTFKTLTAQSFSAGGYASSNTTEYGGYGLAQVNTTGGQGFYIATGNSRSGAENLRIYAACNDYGEYNCVIGTKETDAADGYKSVLLATATDVDGTPAYKHIFNGDGTAWFLGNVSVPDINLNGALLTEILDGYTAPTADLSSYETKADHGSDIKAIIDVIDGYATSTGATGDGYLAFFTGSNKIAGDNDLFWDRANNRLGIQTSAPTKTLSISGDLDVSSPTDNPGILALFTENVTTSSGNPVALSIWAKSSAGSISDGFGSWISYLISDSVSGATVGYTGVVRDGANNSGRYVIYTANAGTITEKFTIKKDGKTGIGTTTPENLLTVYGSASVGSGFATTAAPTNGLLVEGNVGIGVSPSYKLHVYNNTTGSTASVVENPNSGSSAYAFSSVKSQTATCITQSISDAFTASSYFGTTSGNRSLIYTGSSTTNGLWIGTFGSNPLIIGTNDAERIRVLGTGLVGIGTQTPSEKLEVVGNLKITGGEIKNEALTQAFDYIKQALDGYVDMPGSGTTGEIALFIGTKSVDSSDMFTFDETNGLFVDHAAQINGTVLMGGKTPGSANIITEGTWLGLGVAATASTGFDGIEDVVAGHNLEVKGDFKVDGAILNSDLSAQLAAIGSACDGYSSANLSGLQTTVDEHYTQQGAINQNILAALDGYDGTSSADYSITSSKTTGYSSSFSEVVRCDPSSSGFTVTLPAPSGGTGKTVIIKNTTSSSNTITIESSGAELIDGFSSVTISEGYKSLTLVSYGTEWGRI